MLNKVYTVCKIDYHHMNANGLDFHVDKTFQNKKIEPTKRQSKEINFISRLNCSLFVSMVKKYMKVMISMKVSMFYQD